jgi:hypothetical protein
VTQRDIQELYSDAGFDQATAFEAINLLAQQGAMTEEDQRNAHHGLNQLYGREYRSPTDEAERQRLIQRAGELIARKG